MIRFTRLLTNLPQEALPQKIIVWNLTKRCNLSCKHCYIDAGKAKGNELNKDEGFEVISQLASLGFKVLLFSGGEPLLYENLFELNAYAKKKGMKTCLSSNGSLITEEIALKIKEGNFEYVGISIDGTRDVHDRFRGIKGSFDQAWQGLRILKKYGIKRGIRFTLNKENVNCLPDVIRLALNEEIERFCLYHLVYRGRARQEMDIGKEERIEAIEYLVQKVNEIEVLTADSPCDGIYLKSQKKNFMIDTEGLGGCEAGIRIINIAPNGGVYPCQFFEKSLGNIRKKKISEILAHPFLNKLKNRESLKGKCGKCIYKKLCGGCRVRAYAKSGDYFGEDPICYIW